MTAESGLAKLILSSSKSTI